MQPVVSPAMMKALASDFAKSHTAAICGKDNLSTTALDLVNTGITPDPSMDPVYSPGVGHSSRRP